MYVGQTGRNLKIRLDEHNRQLDENSSFTNYLKIHTILGFLFNSYNSFNIL